VSVGSLTEGLIESVGLHASSLMLNETLPIAMTVFLGNPAFWRGQGGPQLAKPAETAKHLGMTTAIYTGSFDPVTYGHLDVIGRAARLFDTLVVAVGAHHAKKALFTADERQAMLVEVVAPIAAKTGCRIEVVTFDDLAVDVARRHGASTFVRGIRNTRDLDDEASMAGMNAAMAPEVDSVFLSASGSVRHIASSLVKSVAAMGGDVSAFVPPQVAEKLRARNTAG
jgi:pantetheine-phosphate adenylyltransferase